MPRRPPTFFPKLLALFLLLIVFPKSNGSENETFVYCSPTKCGDRDVKYPFWLKSNPITAVQYCGYQGLGLDCQPSPVFRDGQYDLFLQCSNQYFYVENINYTDNTVTLVDSEVKRNQTCPRARQNLTLDDHFPLKFDGQDLNLTFYFNCTRPLPFSNTTSTIFCDAECLRSGGNISYVSLETNHEDYRDVPVESGHIHDWFEICEEKVVAAVIKRDRANAAVLPSLGTWFGEAMQEGFVLDWEAEIDCASCESSEGHCGLNNVTKEFLCFCNDGSVKPHRCREGNGSNSNVACEICIVLGTFGLTIIIMSLAYITYQKQSFALILRRKTKEDRNLEAFLTKHGSLAPKRYFYSDIKKMTHSFKDELGRGGYGTVYKGKLLDGRLVAVKILKIAEENGEEFINEVLSISRTSHVNVVTLLGFCLEGKRRALVYEYMSNGSLEKYIHGKRNDATSSNQLGLDKLYQISLGVARGLEYLHRGCNTRILHFDIKPHNILLDDDFSPKISDFGLAKQYTKEESIVSIFGARGTIGYIAPELVSRSFGVVSYKSDVYSYGMMILEIVGRRKNVNMETSHASEIYFPHWAYQHLVIEKDLRLKGVVSMEEDEIAQKIILVGLWCIQSDPSQRPTMSKVIEMLEGDSQAIAMPPKPFFGSPSTTPPQSLQLLIQ